ncbi:sugar transferase [Deinococcus rubellus]|uniref:sugar transferase n=1 Tax=Deinococcus rubellus TaxID=1889240 RepID=UPI0028A77F00|nr:sugar transferase [Deinococcus rubellus]
MPEEKSIIYMLTIPLSAGAFLRKQLAFFYLAGWDVHLATSPQPREDLEKFAQDEHAVPHFLEMQREISPLRDCMALLQTVQLIRHLKPKIVNAGTPKAGLLGMVAAALAQVPVRVYTLHGLRLETTYGFKRCILQITERLACFCAHRVICVSPSLMERAIELKLLPASKAVILGSGTCNGIESERFVASSRISSEVKKLREELNLPIETPTVGFVGRFVKDKGIVELLDAFNSLYTVAPDTRLLLVGDYEEGDPIPLELRQNIDTHPGIIRAGFVNDTAPYYHLMDVLAFPTYREGYPLTPLEAASAGKPVVASNATGAKDAVINGMTGLTIPMGDAAALSDALRCLLEDKDLALRLGKAGQKRVIRDFQPQAIWQALEGLYQELLLEREIRRGNRLKRTLDITASAAGLIILAIPILTLTLLVRFKLGSPIFFSQQRPGLRGKPFTMYKFRTMRDATDTQGQPLPDSERLTPLGRFLRSSSLDELPELFNVLRGDMSLVGPRPLLMEYLPRYTPQQARRHEVRPGITGWAQVNGRNAISWEEKFNLDVWYVDNRSFALDLKILWLTVLKVFKREGINAVGEATMPVFSGTAQSET